MQKRMMLWGIVITLAAAVSVGGCSRKTEAPGASAAQQKTVVKMWTANRSDYEYVQEQIKRFNETNTDSIQLEYSVYSDNYQQTLELAYASNEAPDLFFETGDFFVKFVKQGYFLPIDQYLTPEYRDRFGPGGFIEGINVIDGKTYTMGAIGTSPRLIYNRGIFKRVGIAEPPKSAADMVKAATLITEKLKGEGVYGFAANLKNPASALTRSLVQMLERSGLPVKEGFDFSAGRYDFRSYKPLLEAYKQIFSTGVAFPGCESLDIDPLRTQFANGKIGMYISWNHAEPAVYQNQFPTEEDWSVADIPTIDGSAKGSQDITLSNKWIYVNSNSKNPEKAWKVMQFFYSDDYLAGYYERGLSIVTVPSVLKKATAPETIQTHPALAFGEHDQSWPNIPSGVVPEGQNAYMVFSSIIFGVEKNIDAALLDLNKRYNAAYEKAIADGKTKAIKYDSFDPAYPGKSLSK